MSEAGTALITGASRGIGLAIAEQLAAIGYRVAIAARNQLRLAEAARHLEAKGATVATISADLSDPGAPAQILRRHSPLPATSTPSTAM